MSKKLTSLIYILTFGFMTQIGFASTSGPLATRCKNAAADKKSELKKRKIKDSRIENTALGNIADEERKCLNNPDVKAEIEAAEHAKAQAEAAAREAAERQAAAAREETERKAAGTRERIDNCIAACNHVKNGKLVIPDEKERAACVSNCK